LSNYCRVGLLKQTEQHHRKKDTLTVDCILMYFFGLHWIGQNRILLHTDMTCQHNDQSVAMQLLNCLEWVCFCMLLCFQKEL